MRRGFFSLFNSKKLSWESRKKNAQACTGIQIIMISNTERMICISDHHSVHVIWISECVLWITVHVGCPCALNFSTRVLYSWSSFRSMLWALNWNSEGKPPRKMMERNKTLMGDPFFFPFQPFKTSSWSNFLSLPLSTFYFLFFCLFFHHLLRDTFAFHVQGNFLLPPSFGFEFGGSPPSRHSINRPGIQSVIHTYRTSGLSTSTSRTLGYIMNWIPGRLWWAF